MKGDFTRFTFDPGKGYAQVLKQQGRVDLDADWNEASAIQAYLDRTRATDLIGLCGVPKKNAGFKVDPTPEGDDLTLSPGRIYVGGILCGIGEASYADQPHLPNPPLLIPENDRVDLVYLDVWQRHITAIEDPDLLEVALGGADTTTRVQTVWQVKVRRGVEETECDGEFRPWPPVPPLDKRGTLNTGAVVVPSAADPCLIAPGGGYRGLENRLYRVEIHDGGQLYAWPRPAGAEATAVNDITDGTELEVADWGVDGRDWQVGQMVELYSDETDTSGQTGTLARIEATDEAGSTLTLDTDVSDMVGHANRRLRRVATFKWSRDNGSVVFGIKEFVSGQPNKVRLHGLGRDQVLTLHSDDWVEVLGDETELKELPGTLTSIAADGIDEAELTLTLSRDVSGHDGESRPKVRRWDQKGAAIAVTTELIDLEDGVQIQFGGQDFQAGDYWLFAARTATGQVDVLTDAAPQGVEHAYCRLALIHWQAADSEEAPWQPTTVEDCRPTFPTLTEICAEDVCYDDSNCDAIQAETVQEALDQLCAMRDLRHHNKHLHGWGIVCGLQVECGPDDPERPGDRTTVTARPGYAIDCEGNDIVLSDEMVVPVLRMIKEWEERTGKPLLQDGEGQVCLVIERDEHGQPRIVLRPYDPKDNTLQAMLKGTLLMDFLQDCMLEPLQEIRELLFPPAEEEGKDVLVSPAERQTITLLNLIIQLWNPEHGSHVYLSHKEHEILHNLYLAIRAILQSRTFCAMFDDARPFPQYPFEEARMSTIFDRSTRNRTRLRIHPNGRLGYGVGGDNRIHVYDLRKEELVAVLEVPGGTGLIAQDVAFSENGRQLYAIATLHDKDSIFATAEIRGLVHKWRPVTILCGAQLLTMARAPGSKDTIFAVGKGTGLYVIKLGDVQPNIEPSLSFNAVGHLVVDAASRRAYASAANPDAVPTAYDRVVEIDLYKLAIVATYPLRVGDVQVTGQDDIATVPPGPAGDVGKLYAVADAQEGTQKRLFIFRVGQPHEPNVLPLPDTTIRMDYVPGSRYLMGTLEDYYLVGLVDVEQDAAVAGFQLPVQIAPLAIAVDPRPRGRWVYVVNALSPTITKVAARYMRPLDVPDDQEPPPGSQRFLRELVRYRQKIFEAFMDLVGGLLQYLKDCFCHHLLVNCPTCTADDEVYLASVTIREGEVYKVCNSSRRKYVKSFPTVGYWLSLIPIAPLIRKAVEILCCMVLPEFFGRLKVPQREAYQPPLKSVQLRQGLANLQRMDFRRRFSQVAGQVGLARAMATDWMSSTIVRPPPPREEAMLSRSDIVGQPMEEALRRAEEMQVKAKVETYDPAQGVKNLLRLSQAPLRVLPGSQITLYEQDGVVRHYALAEEPMESVEAIRTELKAQKATLAEMKTLKTTLAEMQSLLTRKDQEMLSLRDQLQALEERQVSREAELEELRRFREEVRRFMTRQDK